MMRAMTTTAITAIDVAIAADRTSRWRQRETTGDTDDPPGAPDTSDTSVGDSVSAGR
jgi:hypothetical protein